ncbi:hypothetical protein DRE_00776 [Drechslerella stenobrocha 248]|uniref:Large ribosomal subunit protein uL23m n=1 Tax=Drechslerella stenobrocha 248 TaxID=1043628 RepID=W7HYW1_9PEZI|nr:hypothetical protein DRE_00776 [Drechslerella stenobrocha 248]
MRTPRLPPTFAQFSVPLNLNKLDLRNYLQNAYGLKVIGIRSFVRHSPVQVERKRSGTRYVRKRAEKLMTIEMREPFVWPEEPKDLTKFDHALYTNIEKFREKAYENARDAGKQRIIPSDSRRKLSQALEEKRREDATGVRKQLEEELTDVDFDAAIQDRDTKS